MRLACGWERQSLGVKRPSSLTRLDMVKVFLRHASRDGISDGTGDKQGHDHGLSATGKTTCPFEGISLLVDYGSVEDNFYLLNHMVEARIKATTSDNS